uniref:tRNA-splicing endonuclease subunit Sen34 n=1 Tax=Nothobranchius furzeri TaxID=105023 RepID=A0A8C6KSM0_NOTFU
MEDQNQESSDPVVALSLCDSTPLLWRAQDLRTVRSQSVVGALLGSLPRAPRQNLKLGRPLLLLPEEERLLRERHAALWVMTERTRSRIQAAEMSFLRREQQRSFEEQSVFALEDRKSALQRAMTSSQSGKNEALQRRLLDLDQNFTFPRSALAIQLSTTRAGLNYCPEARAFLQLDWPIRDQGNAQFDTRYLVFRDLWGRGFFLTSAGKFGGDFLVYPGDPLRFHAHFIAICLSLDEPVSLLDILAAARLGCNVKKTVLLCSPAPNGPVHYTSVQWSGMV